MHNQISIRKSLIILIILSTIVRGFISGFIELGNDEVYYWTYALYPDLSHFDHPPMVGYVIQLFTFNLAFSDEIFIRLGSVIFGAINTWIIFLIGTRIKDQLAGFYAALLYTSSIYCFIIAGIFILPDTPQLFFWLITLYLLIKSLPDRETSVQSKRKLILAGIFIGLGMLSKYTSAYLWIGALLYILFYNRNWFKTKELYLAAVLSLIIILPVIKWNMDHDFISFTYHSGRVDFFGSGLRFDFIATEVLGQFFYNNPFNVLLIIFALVALIKRKRFLETPYIQILLLTSLPLIFTFLFFALFRRTLPHWTGPAYISLILIAAAFLSDKGKVNNLRKMIPAWIKAGLVLLLIVLFAGIGQIRYGIINLSKYGDDITVEMYGWDQLREKFDALIQEDQKEQRMMPDVYLVSSKWFPAAHLDHYVATPLEKKLLVLNTLDEIHKYAWINIERGGVNPGSDAYYITTDLYFKDPNDLYKADFQTIEQPDTIIIYRRNLPVKEVYIYRMHRLLSYPKFDIPENFQ